MNICFSFATNIAVTKIDVAGKEGRIENLSGLSEEIIVGQTILCVFA
jgi:hypothetical protein